MNVADINMKAGFESKNTFNKYEQKEQFFVHNIEIFNKTTTIQDLDWGKQYASCIGVWKVKQLKK